MKGKFCAIMGVMILIVGISSSGKAVAGGHGGHHGHGGHVNFGVSIGPVWGPWFVGPFYPYYPYPYAASPRVIVEEPEEEYVQAAPRQDEESYWYFCPDPKGYYPYVRKCPQGWMKVVPNPSPIEPEE